VENLRAFQCYSDCHHKVLFRSERNLLSSASIILGGTKALSEVDENTRMTAWIILWLRLLAALGMLCLLALVACVILALIHRDGSL
jgi:hypothetical protein